MDDGRRETMDVSPYGAQQHDRSSQRGTPMSHKRVREEDIAELLENPPLNRHRTSPSGMHSPHISPMRASDPMCHTPVGHLGRDGELTAVEMGLRWAVHQRLGARK
jgi:hypothetical protein